MKRVHYNNCLYWQLLANIHTPATHNNLIATDSKYGIMSILKVEIDIIANISASPIGRDIQIDLYTCAYELRTDLIFLWIKVISSDPDYISRPTSKGSSPIWR